MITDPHQQANTTSPKSFPREVTKIIGIIVLVLVLVVLGLLQNKREAAVKVDLEGNIELVKLVSVIDGDTIRVMRSGETEETVIRIIGIDTPEKNGPFTKYECYGQEATDFLENLLISNLPVYISGDPTQDEYDRYDRLLAHVFIDTSTPNIPNSTILVSGILTRSGYAYSYVYENPSLYYEEISNGESYAESHGVGLWGECVNG